jgi:hypothetical protein
MRQNRKNRTVVNRFDIGRIRATNIEVAKPETLLELAARLEHEERERQEAPIRAAENQLKATLRQMTEGYRNVWSMPVEKLRKADREFLEASTPDLGLSQTDYDTMDAGSATTAGQAAKQTFDDFIAALPQRGITLTEDGVIRFSLFVSALAVFRNAAVTVNCCDTALAWLHECFGDEIHHASTTVAEPPQESTPLTLDDVLKQGTDGSRDSDRRLRDAAEFDWLNEHRELISAFLNHLRDVWGFTPTDEQWKFIFGKHTGLFTRMNWSHGDPRNYDSARKYCAKRGIFPSSMLTCGEVAEMQFRQDSDWAAYNYKLQDLTRRGLVNRPRAEAGI